MTMTSNPALLQPPNTKAFGALSKFWYNQHVDTYSKIIFRAIPMNLLLWGCEAWSLQQSLLAKNTPHINVSSQEGTNNKQSSQKTILRHTMCKEYDCSMTTIIHWESCTRSSPTSTYKTNADYMLQQQ
jgi:hypothetical protein